MVVKFLLFLTLSVWILSVKSDDIDRRICSTTPDSSACQQLARNSQTACGYNFHNVDCLLNIENGTYHIGRIKSEDALLAANLLSEDVVVLAEIRSEYPPSATVVIVKTNIPSDFINLKGKKLCHPGFSHDEAIPHFMLKELEYKLVEKQNQPCFDNVTLAERHVSALSEFLGDSCRPGTWLQRQHVDKKLKGKYSSLCRLCNGGSCDQSYVEPFSDSLKCLVDKDADVALTTLHQAGLFFNSSNISNQQNYKFMCKDGTTQSHSSPCVWSRKVYDLLITKRDVANDIENFLRDNLKTKINSTKEHNSQSTSGEALLEILKLDREEKITFLEQFSSYKSLNAYVTENVIVPTPEKNTQCERTLKWCTYSESEQKKCKWLSQAAVNWAIQPVVECKSSSEGNSELFCLDDIRKGNADIVVASADYAYISLNKGLTSIAFPETDRRNLSVILAVKRASDSKISSFKDMKEKSACIPRFGGKEHLAFVHKVREFVNEKDCDYGKLLSDYISDSCVPGVRSALIKESTDLVNKDKLCRRCKAKTQTATAAYCDDDNVNKYFGSEGAIECLRDNAGDFAIISRTSNLENVTDLQVICRNGTVASKRGLDVDDDCALSVLPNSEVVIEMYNFKKNDARNALYEFERWFGSYLHKSFHLFDRFNGEKDLLFLDSTPGLDIDNDVDNIHNYKELLRNVKQCNVNGAAAITYSIVLFVITFIIFV